MAKTLGAYKGLWQQNVEKEAAPQLMPVVSDSRGSQAQDAAPVVPDSRQIQARDAVSPHESAEQLAHRYRMLVLREHRYKLGRDLLETGTRDPWFLAWESLLSLGRSFRPWAHDRIFALGCTLGIEMSPEILKQLRHPIFIGRYRRSMFVLGRLLEMLAQKNGQKPVSRIVFRLVLLCPPLVVLIYERKLQALLREAQGSTGNLVPRMTNARQGQ